MVIGSSFSFIGFGFGFGFDSGSGSGSGFIQANALRDRSFSAQSP
jgi:hypothetical protein